MCRRIGLIDSCWSVVVSLKVVIGLWVGSTRSWMMMRLKNRTMAMIYSSSHAFEHLSERQCIAGFDEIVVGNYY